MSIAGLLPFVVSAMSVLPSAKLPQAVAPTSATDCFYEANRGQWDPSVRFGARLPNGHLLLTEREAFVIGGSGHTRSVMRLRMVGASPRVTAVGIGRLRGVVNYYRDRNPARWCSGVPTYRSVRLSGVYPGVDMVYYLANAKGRRRDTVEFDFVVSPGADPRQIRMEIRGTNRLRLVAGDIVATVGTADIVLKRPMAYQVANGRRVPVGAAFTQARTAAGTPQIAFRLSSYDASLPLVIDPRIEWATYLGGSTGAYGDNSDDLQAVATDATGAVYVVGLTNSIDFPTTSGSWTPEFPSQLGEALYVAKLLPDGSGLAYATYLGTAYGQVIRPVHIAVDPLGGAYVATVATEMPTTAGSFRPTGSGYWIGKLSPTGGSLTYGTYLMNADPFEGGRLHGLAVGTDGSAYATGVVWSDEPFPTTPGAFMSSPYVAERMAWLLKLNPAGSGLVYSTYVGAATNVSGGVCVDETGAAYLAGVYANSNPYPTTPGAYRSTAESRIRTVFVTKMDPSGTALEFSTFVGPGSVNDIAVAPDHAVAISGGTGDGSYPVTAGAFVGTTPGTGRVYVTKLNSVGSDLVFSALLAPDAAPSGVGFGEDGDVWLAGHTRGTGWPTTADAFRRVLSGPSDLFATQLAPDGSSLLFSSLLGGSGEDVHTGGHGGLAICPDGGVIIGGRTDSADCPVVGTPVGGTLKGRWDAYLAKVLGSVTTALAAAPAIGQYGQTVTLSARLYRPRTSVGIAGQTITFSVDGSVAGSAVTDGSGTASLPYKVPEAIGPGSVPLLAEYAGDGTYSPVAASSSFTVSRSETRIFTIDRRCAIGKTTTLRGYLYRATDNGWLAGRLVSFALDGTSLFDENTDANGRASRDVVVPEMLPATYTLTVRFAGDTYYLPASCDGALTVDQGAVWMSVVSPTFRVGETRPIVVYAKRVGDNLPLQGREVAMFVDAHFVSLALTDYAGRATWSYKVEEGALERQVTVEFWGDDFYLPASATRTLTVLKAPTSLSVSDVSGAVGQAVELSATLQRTTDSGRLQGRTISFTVGGVAAGSAVTDSSGRAALSYVVPEAGGAGTRPIGASFPGDANYNNSTGSAVCSVSKAGTTVSVPAISGPALGNAMLSATLTRAPDGAGVSGRPISFGVDGTTVGSASTNASGTATRSYSLPTSMVPGDTKPVSATFAGDASYAPASGSDVLAAGPYLTVLYTLDRTAQIGATTTLRGYLYRQVGSLTLPDKLVTFSVAGTGVGTAVTEATGRASLNWVVAEGGGAGTRTITASFGGDATYAPSSVNGVLTVQKAPTSIYVLDRSGARGALVLLRGYLRRTTDSAFVASRVLDFSIDGSSVGSAVTEVSGRATLNYTVPVGATAGVHPIGVVFAGDTAYTGSSGSATLTVL
jgi:hypothetical protein